MSWNHQLVKHVKTKPSLFSCDRDGCPGTSCHHWVRATWIWVEDSSLETKNGLLETHQNFRGSADFHWFSLPDVFQIYLLIFVGSFFGDWFPTAPLRPSQESVVVRVVSDRISPYSGHLKVKPLRFECSKKDAFPLFIPFFHCRSRKLACVFADEVEAQRFLLCP